MVLISPGTVSVRTDYSSTGTVYTGLHVHKTIISQHGGDWRISVGQNHFCCKRERRRVLSLNFFATRMGFRLTGCCRRSVANSGRKQYPVFLSAFTADHVRVPSSTTLESRPHHLFYSYSQAHVMSSYHIAYLHKNILSNTYNYTIYILVSFALKVFKILFFFSKTKFINNQTQVTFKRFLFARYFYTVVPTVKVFNRHYRTTLPLYLYVNHYSYHYWMIGFKTKL